MSTTTITPTKSPSPAPTLAIRTRPENPDHHLWNNHGIWFVHYTVHPDGLTKERVRKSLGTKSLLRKRGACGTASSEKLSNGIWPQQGCVDLLIS